MRDYPTYMIDDSSADPLKTAMFEMPKEDRTKDIAYVMSKKTLSNLLKAENRRHQALGIDLTPEELLTLNDDYEYPDKYLEGIRIMFHAVCIRESIPDGQFKYMKFDDVPATQESYMKKRQIPKSKCLAMKTLKDNVQRVKQGIMTPECKHRNAKRYRDLYGTNHMECPDCGLSLQKETKFISHWTF